MDGRRGLRRFAAVLALGTGVGLAAAQQPPQPESTPPNSTPRAAAADPAPQTDVSGKGKDAQVQTGSQIGEGSLLDMARRLETLLGDHQFLEVEQMLEEAGAPPPASEGAAAKASPKLSPAQAQLFRGVLDNRENKPRESIAELEPVLERIEAASGTGGSVGAEEKLVRKTLAEDYLRAGEWAKAAAAYKAYDSRMGASLTAAERDEIELPLKLLPLAAAHPPGSVDAGEAFALPYDRDALGLADVPVFVDAASHDWMLDPTAPFNLICRSTAKAVGLKLSVESAVVRTITGRPMEVHATVIPRFTLGTVTFRNMTAFVFDDGDYYFPRSKYQVRGVLGYPAISALGSITVTAASRIEVQPGERGERLTSGAPFYLDGDRLIAELGRGGRPEDERAYVVDASGQQTYLTSRYFAEHAGDFAGKTMRLVAVPGFEDKPRVPAYLAESVTLEIGKAAVNLHFIPVLTEPLGNAAVDDTYGTLGVDALDELKSYTFDYRTMRFGVRSE